jgi:hypothetical protein
MELLNKRSANLESIQNRLANTFTQFAENFSGLLQRENRNSTNLTALSGFAQGITGLEDATNRLSLISVVTTDSALSNTETPPTNNSFLIDSSDDGAANRAIRSPIPSGDYSLLTKALTGSNQLQSGVTNTSVLSFASGVTEKENGLGSGSNSARNSEKRPLSSNSLASALNYLNSNGKFRLPRTSHFDAEELLPALSTHTAMGQPFSIDAFTDATVLDSVSPTRQQLAHRQSIICLLTRQIRIALGCSAFEVGLAATHTILPDDPIRLMLTLSKTSLSNWHTTLVDHLLSLAEKANNYGGTNHIPGMAQAMAADPLLGDCSQAGAFWPGSISANLCDSGANSGYGALGEEVPLKNHFLGNIAHSKQNLTHSVQLVIDSVTVEVVANNRTELVMLGFFEEVAQAIEDFHASNNDNLTHLRIGSALFKRSFLLLRTYWAYETTTIVGCVVRHYLSDYHLFLMLTNVFNQHFASIESPLHALSLFLAEYAGYEPSSQAISLHGLLSFLTRASNQPLLPPEAHILSPVSSTTDVAASKYLLKAELLERYWYLFNITFTQDSSAICDPTFLTNNATIPISSQVTSPIAAAPVGSPSNYSGKRNSVVASPNGTSYNRSEEADKEHFIEAESTSNARGAEGEEEVAHLDGAAAVDSSCLTPANREILRNVSQLDCISYCSRAYTMLSSFRFP